MGIVSDALSQIPGEDLLKFAPLIIAVAKAYRNFDNEKALAVSVDSIERGLQYAVQTGDTSQLENSILSHCGPNGCRVA